MKTRQAVIAGVVLAVGSAAYSLALLPYLPDRIPTHWNIHGEVDGWGSRAFGAWFVPGMVVGMVLLMLALPWLSPRHFRVDEFRQVYNYIMVMVLAMFVGIHALMLQAALHPGLDIGRWLIVVLCVFSALIGNVMGKVRRNFWMGFRTPWTLASETVWIATHRLGARLMVGTGLTAALLVGLGGPPVVAFVLIVAGALYPALYSLILYKRLEREGKA